MNLEASKNPNAITARNSFTYYHGMAHIGASVAPKIMNKSYTITIPIDTKQKSEGVLVAHGNHTSGYTIYIKNKRAVYEYNNMEEVFRIESKKKVPTGPSTITFEFKVTGQSEGIGTLYIDDEQVGTVQMNNLLDKIVSNEGLDVGRDRLSPVSKNYSKEGEFQFNGKIEKVNYELEPAAK
ncbi:hypothetical protein [Bacillus sp. OK048]|uniref:hypothetical protein n=1 Tax=Bacillus sp. OK048 TaxID=1882761 RepID=UPI0008815B8F|nr:hypothetical protein [Bacillus sp. OK048]SDL97707.1 hypothetical protein SAMN05443253_101349 [Bacillus sp. OK048]